METSAKGTKNKRKKAGRRRRGKKDVVLDFTKRVKPKRIDGELVTDKPASKTKKLSSDKTKNNESMVKVLSQDDPDEESDFMKKSKTRNSRDKLSLTTSSKDYEGAISLPEKVSQREYETTSQFFRRLDRLAAKAKVEASMESRFDMTLERNVKAEKKAVISEEKVKRFLKRRVKRY